MKCFFRKWGHLKPVMTKRRYELGVNYEDVIERLLPTNSTEILLLKDKKQSDYIS